MDAFDVAIANPVPLRPQNTDMFNSELMGRPIGGHHVTAMQQRNHVDVTFVTLGRSPDFVPVRAPRVTSGYHDPETLAAWAKHPRPIYASSTGGATGLGKGSFPCVMGPVTSFLYAAAAHRVPN